MNTIADMLAACVNSAGDTGATSPCGVLFQSTTSGSTVPSETATAAMILAQNPGLPSSSLFTLVDATAPFQPTLPAAPTDFSLVIHYTGAGIAQPSGLAVDPTGNIWVANAGSNSLTVFDASGVNPNDPAGFLSGANGFAPAGLLAPSAVAIDALGNAWTTGGKSNNLISLSPSGSLLASYSGSNFNLPAGVAIDNLGTVWVTNSGNSTLAEVSSTGTITAVTSGPLAQPTAIAINPH
jgi:DNA-binding beta-propeller fold protein YncE